MNVRAPRITHSLTHSMIVFMISAFASPASVVTVTGCRLGGLSVRRDRWGGERVVGGVLPRISVGTWGLCARLCLVLVCGGRYGLGEGFFSSSWDRVWAE